MMNRKKLVVFVAIIIAFIIGLGFISKGSIFTKSFNKIENQNHNIYFKYNLISHKIKPKFLGEPEAMIAIDAKNGQIVYAHNENKPEKIASLSKLMTLYLVIQKAQKNHAWNQIVNTTNPNLVRMSHSYDLGGFDFKQNHKYTVKELYKAALIRSSNNAAIALGEWVAGSNKKFINMMNQQAKIWGLKAHFVSSSGLENSDLKHYGYNQVGNDNDGNEVSAKDIGKIAVYILKAYPSIVDDSIQAVTYDGDQTIYNENGLLPGKEFYDPSLGVDGLKTGYTDSAGLCFVGTGKVKGKDRLVTVTLNDDDEFSNTIKLMKFVYKNSTLYK
ncbi:D-alanyl-D-alanine carboxypeptidase family protein [Apilactobacillus micheneri]|uniref:D-alanyl-D-alanine carboxypeptidase n=2 Tax=Apilactobacillus micheneri TaxID=1899430 RepID=A0A9Q8IMZ5_9LACO|nr:serine hydrolase [Apilactobacillus micheneri]TPR40975.1 D-alanyl-D-alanine carboxypeptidase [Apilactobacillus micheneri]TPR42555.1 D-alanyl-D-alanine carboxypeptidase [Apilactobacillus micheneri]TPR45524.1 D-alanyl-D-alanine carboxypeptidase [Apilactobacillus micheneri]TPR46082.1 D-alanyl-D-alanine carboxypeptidase [Apilactobacillus micheneri]TPR46767.1 D-alanyl-D-alanine carboxypeptidase [Apilactobacillus micheneri]